MRINYLRSYLPILGALALSLAGASSAPAQITTDRRPSPGEISIDRTTDELRTDVGDALRHDIDTTDTALVFNAPGPGHAVVHCRAFDQNGTLVGRTVTKVPDKGLRYIRASDLANGQDFIGSAFCRTRGNVLASAVFIAPGAITQLNVDQSHIAGTTDVQRAKRLEATNRFRHRIVSRLRGAAPSQLRRSRCSRCSD